MPAFRPLPFQYQQRGPDLAGKLEDPETYARYNEQRDQDLENYLAGLTASAGSETVSFVWIALTQVAPGAGDTFDSAISAWYSSPGFEPDLVFTDGAGLSFDDKGNVVLTPGVWQIDPDIAAQFDTATTGFVVITVYLDGIPVSSRHAFPEVYEGGLLFAELNTSFVMFAPTGGTVTISIDNQTDANSSFPDFNTHRISGTRVSLISDTEHLQWTP